MKRAGLFIIAALISLAAWAFWIEPSWVVFREQTLKTGTLPKGLSGLKVALLTDLHIGAPHITLSRLEDIVEKTNAHEPDLILLGGDYVIQGVRGGTVTPPSEIFPVLNRLKAPLGVYAVMGNHDWWWGYTEIVTAFREGAPDIPLLEDKALILSHKGQSFALLGITDFNEGPMRYHEALQELQGTYVMALTHTPDIFPELPGEIALTFAGHTHGGQVYIPFIGRPVVPSRFGERFAAGLIEEDGRHMFVSTGVGTSILGVRFLVPPEVNILTLKTKAN